ncbi:MAG: hypothetical protein ACD_35C00163G0002 [uncultured bacterium]|nr:MAG: hypothetical protein ACD_35C00163G0002 [uncultured bacterium]HCS38959.1 hypothetical protein [Anaerolineaceae bacterium]
MSNIFIDYMQPSEKTMDNEREYSRIMTAAVVNERFRKLLLSNPSLALKSGYGGEAFNLESEESERISAIKATSLAEFARQMNGCPPRTNMGLLAAD